MGSLNQVGREVREFPAGSSWYSCAAGVKPVCPPRGERLSDDLADGGFRTEVSP